MNGRDVSPVSELQVQLFLPDGKDAFTRDEVGEYVGNAAAQAYKQGYHDAFVDRARHEPPRTM